MSGLVTTATFTPSDFLAFDAVLAADVSELRDPAGNAFITVDETTTVPDPGSLSDNLGFESALDSWVTLGDVIVTDTFEGMTPVSGIAHAVVRQEGTLFGYFDVPADATRLALSVALFSEIGEIDPDYTAVIALHRAGGERAIVFDAYDQRELGESCADCTEYGHKLGPLRAEADLTPFQGERLILTVEVRSAFFIGVNYYALVLDDILIE